MKGFEFYLVHGISKIFRHLLDTSNSINFISQLHGNSPNSEYILTQKQKQKQKKEYNLTRSCHWSKIIVSGNKFLMLLF